MAEGPLEGKVVVVIGGTTGLGLSGVRACLAAGARVVAVGPDPAERVDPGPQLAGSLRVVHGDARDPETARRAIAVARSDWGAFDGLYHVAGGSGRALGDGPLHEITDAGWEETLRLNLTSLFHSNRAAAEQLLAQGTGGSVLNMGSVLGSSPSSRFFATHAYAAAKAAVQGLTVAAASYYAPHAIRFNALLPGLTETPMSRRALGDPDVRRFVETKQPLDGGRAGQPRDLDAAVVFFLSDASRFVTGQALAVDGGWTVTDGGPRG
jgi:NAD(P)-dependent dehydrogenase (short-subunit alcohol dehydrogenase family)